MSDIATTIHHNAYDWMQLLALGGLVGALGQGVRTVVGLKKAHDTAVDENKALADVISASRLLVSLLIGFIAGALASLGIIGADLGTITTEQIFAIAAAGYAGADFIEGLTSRLAGQPKDKSKETSADKPAPEQPAAPAVDGAAPDGSLG